MMPPKKLVVKLILAWGETGWWEISLNYLISLFIFHYSPLKKSVNHGVFVRPKRVNYKGEGGYLF